MLSTERSTRPHPFRYPHRPILSSHLTSIRTMSPDPENIEHIWIITGPAGCGKTTVAQHLASELSLPYIEGDDVCISESLPCPGPADARYQYHPTANKQKMASGNPLTDADRWDWL